MTGADMVEKVAKALMARRRAGDEDAWGNSIEEVRESFRKDARAAITAMEIPTPTMQAAGSGALGIENLQAVTSYGAAGRAWAAMVPAALTGTAPAEEEG